MRAPRSGIRLVGGAGNTGFSMDASTISLRIKERKAPGPRSQTVRVMMWPDRSPNPFIPLLIENLGADYEVVGFSFRAALLSRYQVLHVQLARSSGTQPVGSEAKSEAVSARHPHRVEQNKARSSLVDCTLDCTQ
jgi:hypothetical protein